MYVCVCVCKSFQLCLTLRDPMDHSPPGSSVYGILQARILEWISTPSSRGSSDPGIELTSLMSPALAGRFFTLTLLYFFFFLIGVELIYNVVLVSDVQQSHSVIQIQISVLFQILFPCRLLQHIEQSSLCYTVGLYWLSICICAMLSHSVMSDSL